MSIARWGIITGRVIGKASGNKGNYGEMIVSSIFDTRFFGKEEHYIVDNIIFEPKQGETHQIDHIVIYKTGVFVIETKHMKGIIKGKEDDYQWVQVVGKKIYPTLNPINQNQTHVKIVNAFLEDNYDVHSIVVFSRSNKPKEVPEFVLNLEALKDYVKYYKSNNELSSEQMQKIYNSLVEYKNNCNVTKKDHVSNISK